MRLNTRIYLKIYFLSFKKTVDDILTKNLEKINEPRSNNDNIIILELELAYIPCCAHIIQLIVKDGLKMSDEYTNLINKLSRDIVSKSKSRVVSDEHFAVNSTLDFWKSNELRFKNLAKMAKKCLGAPASSAAVERMFSIAGHIFSCKRRRMGDVLFAILVFLKLNEAILKTI